MGDCKFCKKPVGFLRSTHVECQFKYDGVSKNIISLIENSGFSGANLSTLEKDISVKAKSAYINKESRNQLLISGWEKAVERAFDDGILTAEEESNLAKLMNYFSLSQADLNQNGAYTKIVKGAVLRDILEGNIPEKIKTSERLPFNFQKTEKIVWVFQDVEYYEEKRRTRYVGGSKGVSVRIAKGLYYRTGAFKGEREQTSETIHADTGLFCATDKHIYFSGSSKRFRIAFNKIVAFEPFSDGMGVQRDAQTATLQTFITGDGWFVYNLITNLAQI